MIDLDDLEAKARRFLDVAWRQRVDGKEVPGPAEVLDLVAEVRRLQQWVNDLQAGMFINCVYCGHRYGPSDEVPASMADVLKEHVEQCPKHPMSALKAENAVLLLGR